MRELAFLITGLSEDDARKLRRRRPSRAPARVVGWALLGVALLYLLAGAKPVVEIASPASGTTTLDAQILVTGRATGIEGDAVTLEANGSPQTVPVFNGSFEAQVSLVPGDNVIRASANDISSVAVEVFRLQTGIAITFPPDGYRTDQETVGVTGTVDNPSAAPITLKVNESRRTVSVQNGAFASDVVLQVGKNRIQAIIEDASTNEIVVNRTLPPVIITLTSPQSGSTQDLAASVRGTIQNARSDNITVMVNGAGQVVPVSGGGFAADVPLKIGNNVIRALQGEAVSNEVVVKRESLPVVIQILSPQNGSTQDSRIKVTGTITTPQGPTVTLTVNGVARSLAITNGSFASDVDLEFGDNHIRVSQGEAVSNEVVVNRPLPPILIEITAPRSGTIQASSGNSSVKVSGTIKNQRGDTVTLTVNGVARSLSIENRRFASVVELTIGDNHIQALQGEAVSNEVVINLLKPKTLIEITSPRSSKTQRSSVTVTGTITNPSSQTITLTVNDLGRKLTTTNDRFATDVNLEVGENRIRASQNDSLSNEVIMVRQPPPSIKIISPPGGSARQSVVTVTGRVENAPDAAIRFTVNGSSRSVRITNGVFTAEATLIPGENLIEASVKGASDRITLVRPKIPIDPPKVRIIIDTPKNGEITEQRAQDVRGRVENGEAKGISLTLNGTIRPVRTAPGLFQSRVTLLPGKNSIRASLGNASDEVTVTLLDVPLDACSKINCDCQNVKKAALGFAGTVSLLTAAGRNESPPSSTPSAGSTPQDRQAQCREVEYGLKKKCEATGKVSGTCPPGASGPSAWPPPPRKSPASSPRILKKLGQTKEKEGVKKP